MTTALTIEFKGVLEKALKEMIRKGYVKTKTEAVRYAVLHYVEEMGLIKEGIHKRAEKYAYEEIKG